MARKKIRDTVFLPYIQVQRAVRDERWKLIRYPKLGYSQLFDLQNDSNETTSVYDDPARAPDIARLTAAMKTWQQKVGDTLALNTGSNPPPKIDLTGKERKTDQWQPEWIVKNISTQRSSSGQVGGRVPAPAFSALPLAPPSPPSSWSALNPTRFFLRPTRATRRPRPTAPSVLQRGIPVSCRQHPAPHLTLQAARASLSPWKNKASKQLGRCRRLRGSASPVCNAPPPSWPGAAGNRRASSSSPATRPAPHGRRT